MFKRNNEPELGFEKKESFFKRYRKFILWGTLGICIIAVGTSAIVLRANGNEWRLYSYKNKIYDEKEIKTFYVDITPKENVGQISAKDFVAQFSKTKKFDNKTLNEYFDVKLADPKMDYDIFNLRINDSTNSVIFTVGANNKFFDIELKGFEQSEPTFISDEKANSFKFSAVFDLKNETLQDVIERINGIQNMEEKANAFVSSFKTSFSRSVSFYINGDIKIEANNKIVVPLVFWTIEYSRNIGAYIQINSNTISKELSWTNEQKS
ncbi:hypothetical protein ACWXVL_00400 [Mycoplasma sp. 128]